MYQLPALNVRMYFTKREFDMTLVTLTVWPPCATNLIRRGAIVRQRSSCISFQLNETVRIISGTLQSTPIPCFPVLSHIPPPHLWRKDAMSKWLKEVEFSDHLQLFSDTADIHTMSYIVDPCQLTKLDGGLAYVYTLQTKLLLIGRRQAAHRSIRNMT